MKHCIAWLTAVLLLGGLCGCAVGTGNVENSKKLRVGMTKEQVLKIMGEPLSGETFCKLGGETCIVAFIRTADKNITVAAENIFYCFRM